MKPPANFIVRFYLSAIFVATAFFTAATASASFPLEIIYPVPELGSCSDRLQCKSYCDEKAHWEACTAVAKKYGITASKTKVEKILGSKPGPGGCATVNECRTYCEIPKNGSACIDFGVKNKLISATEAIRAKNLLGKTGPVGCQGIECVSVCRATLRETECFAFAKKYNLVNPEDENKFEAKQKINARLETFGGPSGCRTKEACDRICKNPLNAAACSDFAEKAAREVLTPPPPADDNKAKDAPPNFTPQDSVTFPPTLPKKVTPAEIVVPKLPAPEPVIKTPATQKPIAKPAGQAEYRFPQGFRPGGCATKEACDEYCKKYRSECRPWEVNKDPAQVGGGLPGIYETEVFIEEPEPVFEPEPEPEAPFFDDTVLFEEDGGLGEDIVDERVQDETVGESPADNSLFEPEVFSLNPESFFASVFSGILNLFR